MVSTSTPEVRSWLGLAGWLAITALAGLAGAIASFDAKTLYESLALPAWAPPSWLFGPVWTLLYAAMAIAAWTVWRDHGFAKARLALFLYLVQLAVNAIWTWLFFAWRRGDLAFVDIIVLALLVAAMIASFWRRSRVAAAMLVPYLVWILYALALNYSAWQANPSVL